MKNSSGVVCDLEFAELCNLERVTRVRVYRAKLLRYTVVSDFCDFVIVPLEVDGVEGQEFGCFINFD